MSVRHPRGTALHKSGPSGLCWRRTREFREPWVISMLESRNTVHRYLNNGWPTRWHLLYYILLNMFQTLIRPSSGASEYLLCCVGWIGACWCYVEGLSVGDVVSECRLTTLGYHITNRQSRYITPARLKSAYTTQQVLASSWRWTY